MKTQVNFDALGGGGGNADEIKPTVTNKSFSCEWNFDASAIIMFYTANGTKHLALFNDFTSAYMWLTNTSIVWQSHSIAGAELSVTITRRTLSVTAGSLITSFTDVTVIPLKEVPIGY